MLAAPIEGTERDDLRVLAILVTWLGVHHPWLNAERLHRAVDVPDSERARAFWAAVGKWLGKDRRLARLAALHNGPRIDLLRSGTNFQIQRRARTSASRGWRYSYASPLGSSGIARR